MVYYRLCRCLKLFFYFYLIAKNGNNIQLIFGINLHEKDIEILDQIKNSLEAGILTKNPSESVISYKVKSIKGLINIINHFDNYPLVSTKRREYLIFREAFKLLENKYHLTTVIKLVYLKNLLNKGRIYPIRKNKPLNLMRISQIIILIFRFITLK